MRLCTNVTLHSSEHCSLMSTLETALYSVDSLFCMINNFPNEFFIFKSRSFQICNIATWKHGGKRTIYIFI